MMFVYFRSEWGDEKLLGYLLNYEIFYILIFFFLFMSVFFVYIDGCVFKLMFNNECIF